MSTQIPTTCLRQIFRWLKSDKTTCFRLCFVTRTWSEVATLYLYHDPWTLLLSDDMPQCQRKLAITKLLRTYLSCLDYDSFDSEESEAIDTINALCSHVGYLSRFYLLIQTFFHQMNPILDEIELQHTVEVFQSVYCSALKRPVYDYLSLARSFDLIGIQDFLRLAKSNPLPFLSLEYTSEEAAVDQRLALKLWNATLSKCASCVTRLAWDATIPIKNLFLERQDFSSLTHLELQWRYEDPPNRAVDNHLEYVAKACHILERLHIVIESTRVIICDSDLAKVIQSQRDDSLKEIKIYGVNDPLLETLESLIERHSRSISTLRILKNNSGQIPLARISAFPNLRTLELVDCLIRDQDLESIAIHGASLRNIILRNLRQITWSSVRKLIRKAELNLRELVVEEIQEHTIDSDTVKLIAQNCQDIQHFQIEMICIDNVDLALLLCSCHKLKFLSFGGLSNNTPLDGDQLVHMIIDNCPLLRHLYAPEMITTESALQALLQHHQLEKISLPTVLI